MKDLICIACPNGCRISVEESSLKVYNNKCKRGEEFGKNEVTNPKRSVTSTVKSTVKGFSVVSVRTSGDIPKEKVFLLMDLLKTVVINQPLEIGSIVIKNVFDTGIDVITTTQMK